MSSPHFTAAGIHACAGKPEPFDTDDTSPRAVAAAKAICRHCPVRAACLQWAVDVREPHRVWGGLTPGERRRIPAGTDLDLLVRQMDATELFRIADRVIRKAVSRRAADTVVDPNDLDRALLVLRNARHLAPMVVDGQIGLTEAALQADPAGRRAQAGGPAAAAA